MIGSGKQKLKFSGGSKEKVAGKKHVVVVGGGLGGVAAATVLAERGVAVTIIEKEKYLGGRVGAWTEKLPGGEPFEMERGFHAFFRQYYNLRNLLRRIDPELKHLMPLQDYPVLGPDGYMESFQQLPTQPPFNVMELVRRTPTLKVADLTRTNVGAAMKMLSFDMEKTYIEYDSMNAGDYLDSLNFPPQARRMLFDVFSHSFFNPEREMSAGELLMMFHFYFMGNNEGLIFDVLVEPFSDALWKPFERYLAGLGVKIITGAEVSSLEKKSAKKWAVKVKGKKENINGDAVVLAVTVPALKKIVKSSKGLNAPQWEKSIGRLDLTLPFAVWRLWLDKSADDDRYPFVGTAGLGIIDNISLYELFEGESRRYRMRHGGSVVEIHAYAVPEHYEEARIKKELRQRLYELYPETRSTKVLHEKFLLRRDCPAFPPGGYDDRPEDKTPGDGLMIAGDLVRLPIPSALMERATASGFLAANHLLAEWDVKGQDIFSLSTKGIFSFLER